MHSFEFFNFFIFRNNGIEQHRIACRPVFGHYIISDRNRAFDSFVGIGPGSDSGCRVPTEKIRPHPTQLFQRPMGFVHHNQILMSQLKQVIMTSQFNADSESSRAHGST